MASLYFGIGKKDNAKLFARRALEHFQKAGYGKEEHYLKYEQYRPARLMRFGWIYICLGETEKGLDMFREMAAVNAAIKSALRRINIWEDIMRLLEIIRPL